MGIDNVYGTGSLRPGVCTSTSRPGSPFEGQLIYETDTNKVYAYNGSSWEEYRKAAAGQVLQVVSTTKTDTTSTTTQSYQDISGMSVTITPSSTSSKVLVLSSFQAGSSNSNTALAIQLVRGSTAISIGDAASNRVRASVVPYTEFQGTFSINYLDSPNTTSSTTYKLQWYSIGGSACYMNRVNFNDDDAAARPRTASTITVMEISG